MRRDLLLRMAPALGVLLLLPLVPARPAQAGCGCDHPPPGWAAVMPSFGSPGKTVRVNAPEGASFTPGASYLVKIGGGESIVVASKETHLLAPVPANAQPGPSEVEVVGPGGSHKYAKREFTVLAAAPRVPEASGLFVYPGFRSSISEDGTLLVPFNLADVAEATQFAVMIRKLPVAFGHDDVVFFNADGVDLTLFTLAVDDPTQRQWGSYHGWEVEQDTGIHGVVYDNKILDAIGSSWSNLLTYWRHEFQTYRDAHAPGGTHEVGSHGYHVKDGTLHIDHDHLVLAVSGHLRDSSEERSAWDPLPPGYEQVDVFVLALQSPAPVEPEMMHAYLLEQIFTGSVTVMAPEGPEAYADWRDDD